MKKIFIISGSLREKSYNTKLAKYLHESLRENYEVEFSKLDQIPFFNSDLESDQPKQVKQILQKINYSDTLILCSPEYNNTFPGVVKNFLEWASIKSNQSNVEGKPLALLGVTTGGFGTVRALNDLFLLASNIGFKIDFKDKFPISHAKKVFHEETNDIIDLELKQKVDDFIENFLLKIK